MNNDINKTFFILFDNGYNYAKQYLDEIFIERKTRRR